MAFKNIVHHFGDIEEVKPQLLRRWMSSKEVQKTLRNHHITSDFFSRYFGSKVIDYAAGVIEGKNSVGNCPVIGVMLVFFEKKEIPLGDVFTICVNLKNAMIDYALEAKILDHALLNEICSLIDKNFLGVIEEYLDMHYNPVSANPTCIIAPKPAQSGNTFCSVMNPSLPFSKATTALEYAREDEIDPEILDELAELEEETLSSLHLSAGVSEELRFKMIHLFTRYSKMVERMMEFQELTYALSVLIDLLKTVEFRTLKEESTYIIIYAKAIISDLSIWRVSVFVNKSAEDIHYLDKTLLSSIAQLQIMLSPQHSGDLEEIEFF